MSRAAQAPAGAVAIIGMGCRFPGGADSPASYWRLLRDGIDAVSEVPADRYDLDDLFDADPAAPGKVYTRWGGFLEAVDGFDATFFGIAPREARRMDPQQRLLLEVVWEALEDGGQPPDRLAGTNAGVFVGISTREYTDVQLLPLHPQRIDGHVNAGTAFSIAANRVSYLLDLRGPSFAVDTACSSSLTAVHLAARSLAAGECDVAIAGGVGVLLAPEVTVGFCKASMLSPTGRCRAFDAAADGYVRAEGAGAVVLKSLERALADGDPIQAVILGSAINQDGRTTGLSLPSATAQQAMLADALRDAGVAAADIGYVEAHGTGTPAGDPIEAEAIGTVLAAGRSPAEPCLIGSAKTNLGHLEAAAGMAGLIKAVLALQHRQVPPSLHFNEPNPDIDFEALRLRVPTALEPWPPARRRALAGVNSFGFGGANAHVVLAEPPAPEPAAGRDADGRDVHVVPLSARSPEALVELARRHLRQLDDDPPPSLHDLAHTAALRRSHHTDRLALVARTTDELREQLKAFLEGEQRAGWVAGRAHPAGEPRLAFVCTGMGPQWWGMARTLLAAEPAFRDTIEQVDTLLEPLADWSLMAELRADEQASRVADADVAHVANLAVQVGLAATWRAWGIVPDAVVGHSSGEMAAAVLSGALTLPDAVELAFHRGRLQHRTTGSGRMLAAGLTLEEARQALAGFEDRVSLAAVNGPESVTLSGTGDALARIAETLERQGRFARFLAVEVPYHGPQMETIRDEFRVAAASVRPRTPDVLLASVVTGSWVEGADLDADYWWRNVRDTVQFAEAAARLVEAGCEVFVELGPHPVLAPAISAVAAERGVTASVLPSLRRDEDDQEVLARTLAALHVRGRGVDWEALYPAGTCIRLPAYPWQRERYWFDDEEEGGREPARLAGVDTGHPLLGRRLPSAQPIWETRLGTPETAFLDAHVVQDTALFPGAGYLEMALAAARDLWGDTPALLEDVRFRKLLFLEPAGGAVQTVHQPRDGALDIYSEPSDGETEWAHHTSARLSRQAAGTQAPLDLDDLRVRCDTPLAVEEHYRILEGRGYGFGPAFRTLRDIRLGPEGDALARVGFPDGVVQPLDDYRVHPALLDAAIQLFGAVSALTADLRADAPFFPVSIRRLAYRRPPGAQFWAYLVVHHGDDALIEGDAWLLNDDGAVAVSLEGLRLQVLDDQRPEAAPDVDDWLYELRWEPAEEWPGRPSTLPPAAAVRAAAEARVAAPARAAGVARYLDPVEPVLNRAAAGFAAAALAELGWEPGRDASGPAADAAAALGVAPAHRRLFATLCERALARGSETGAAEEQRGLGRGHDVEDPHALLDRLAASAPDYATEAELLRRGGARLADVLRGDIDARELLLSGDALELLARFYTDSPPCRAYHDLLAGTVAAAVAERDAGTPLRVLELGAGTGAATAAVLPRLPEGTEYVFTDVSPHFLADAQRRFGGTADVRCALLDIEQDPTAQGFDPGTFDLVVAANVLHVTADLDRTLPNIRALLADGGLLALLELTRESAWLDLVFGLLEGWWRFTDRHRRPSGPMLAPDEWCALLSAHGFTDAGVLHRGDGADDAPLNVLLAQSPGRATAAARSDRPPRNWILFADGHGIAAGLARQLEHRGDTCTLVRPGEEYRQEGDATLTLPPGDATAYRQLLDDVPVGDGPLGLIHLWSLDIPSDVDADGMMDGQELGCESVLALVQALDQARAGDGELWLISSGAQPVPGMDAAPHVAQSPLWGLGRVLISEDADIRCRLVDLGPRPDSDLAALADVLDGADEDEQALRDGQRFVRRLRRTTLAEHAVPRQAQPRSPDTSAFRLEIDAPGSLERLALRESPPANPGPGEVAVRVRASGLNFRDVLQALGMLPAAAYQYGPDPEGLGIECAGVVVACGQGVTRFEPGDEVMALTAAAHASQVIAREDLTVPKPSGLSFAQAASVMNAFATVEHALRRSARLAPGERVLIHSATGAVGLAAIQLCRRVGAEVFATAGNPDKRAYLRELGVEHVMDSRSLAFGDEVLRATDGEGVDVVLNSLTGEALRKSLEILAPHGRFIELGKRDILADAQLGLLPFQRNLSFHAIDLIGLGLERPAEAKALIDDVAAELEDGVLDAVPTTEFDLADAHEAFRLMAKAQHIGKVLLTVEAPEYPVHARDDAPLFDPDGTYLITGGMGGFGLAVAEWMAREGAGSIALLSRSGMPKEDRRRPRAAACVTGAGHRAHRRRQPRGGRCERPRAHPLGPAAAERCVARGDGARRRQRRAPRSAALPQRAGAQGGRRLEPAPAHRPGRPRHVRAVQLGRRGHRSPVAGELRSGQRLSRRARGPPPGAGAAGPHGRVGGRHRRRLRVAPRRPRPLPRARRVPRPVARAGDRHPGRAAARRLRPRHRRTDGLAPVGGAELARRRLAPLPRLRRQRRRGRDGTRRQRGRRTAGTDPRRRGGRPPAPARRPHPREGRRSPRRRRGQGRSRPAAHPARVRLAHGRGADDDVHQRLRCARSGGRGAAARELCRPGRPRARRPVAGGLVGKHHNRTGAAGASLRGGRLCRDGPCRRRAGHPDRGAPHGRTRPDPSSRRDLPGRGTVADGRAAAVVRAAALLVPRTVPARRPDVQPADRCPAAWPARPRCPARRPHRGAAPPPRAAGRGARG
jgi:acyl transferase domain-containing protein/NADPH:quinone reductase-like Zn-dependent oxidoreductase